MRLERGTRITSTVAVAVASSVVTTILLAGGYAVASTALAPNSVTSANIVNGTIRGIDLSERLRNRIRTPGPVGPQGPQGPEGPQGRPGPPGTSGLRQVQIAFPWDTREGQYFCEGTCPNWGFPKPWINGASPDVLALTINSEDYPSGATARAGFLWSAGSLGSCVRIFDLTTDQPLGSETCHTPDHPGVRDERYDLTGSFALPAGEHQLAWQMQNPVCVTACLNDRVYVAHVDLVIEWP